MRDSSRSIPPNEDPLSWLCPAAVCRHIWSDGDPSLNADSGPVRRTDADKPQTSILPMASAFAACSAMYVVMSLVMVRVIGDLPGYFAAYAQVVLIPSGLSTSYLTSGSLMHYDAS